MSKLLAVILSGIMWFWSVNVLGECMGIGEIVSVWSVLVMCGTLGVCMCVSVCVCVCVCVIIQIIQILFRFEFGYGYGWCEWWGAGRVQGQGPVCNNNVKHKPRLWYYLSCNNKLHTTIRYNSVHYFSI